MPDILFVTWDGGGNVPPAIGIARELQARGHTVRFLGHARQEAALTAAGFEFVRPREARAFSGREPNSPFAMMAAFGDAGMGRDLLAETASRPADLLVIDCLMFGAMHAARGAGLRYAVLEHLYDGYYRRGCLGGPLGLSLRLRRLHPAAALEGAALRLLTTVPELDPVAHPPANLRRTGPVVDVAPREDVDRPRILVSLSTFGFAGMTDTLQKIVDATRGLGADVVVTTGPVIDPGDITAPTGVEVHRFVPHVELMPRASLLVGHGGHGSTMQALAHDLPVLVVPMDRMADQPTVGRSLVEAGAGRVASRKDSVEVLRAAMADLLADGPHRAAAARLGVAVRRLPGAALGADAVEGLVGRAAPTNGAA